TAIETPMHRLEAARHMTVGDNLRQRTNDVGLVLEIHRAIRVVPFAEYAEALEIGALQVDLFRRIFAAQFAELRGIDFLPDLADFFLHRDFYRQTVAIPTRHIGRSKARHELGTHHHV